MLIDWSTTWLFVNTSPDDVMIIPVPEAAPVEVAVWTTVLMSTRAGSTLAAMACALIVPLWLVDGVTAEMGAVELDGSECCGALATGVWLEECRYRAMVRPMPTPRAPAACNRVAPEGAAGSDLWIAVRSQTSGQLQFCALCVDLRLTTECLRTIRGFLELAETELPKHGLRVLPKFGRGFGWHGRGRPEPQGRPRRRKRAEVGMLDVGEQWIGR